MHGHWRIEYESFKESILWRNSDLVVSCNMILIRLYLGQQLLHSETFVFPLKKALIFLKDLLFQVLSIQRKIIQLPPEKNYSEIICGYPQFCRHRHCSISIQRFLDSTHLLSLLTLFNPLNPELNHICYLLALLGAHHFLHFSRIRVKSLTLRLLMSYIYMEHLFLMFLDHTQRRTTVGRTPLDE